MTIAAHIATEIMATIERERRINKDDLIAAVERSLAVSKAEQEKAHPVRGMTPSQIRTDALIAEYLKRYYGATPAIADPGHIHSFSWSKFRLVRPV